MIVLKKIMRCHIITKRTVHLATFILILFVSQNKSLCLPQHTADLSTKIARLVLSGSAMTNIDIKNLEKRLASNTDDLDAHTIVLGYYFAHNTGGTNLEQMRHILWVIQHHPESEVAGSSLCMPPPIIEPVNTNAVKKAWQEQISRHPKCAAVFANAGSYLSIILDKHATNLLMQAHILEPQNPKWLALLGENYKFQISTHHLGRQQIIENHQYASKSFDFYDRALRLTKDTRERTTLLSELVPIAFTAERFEVAQKYAVLLLNLAQQHPKQSFYSLANPIGHTILGKLELRNGHIEQANQHLLKSSEVEKVLSDRLLPDVSLARELLKAGQRKPVIEFLTRCKRFCRRAELDDWISEIDRGLMPDFDSLPF